MAIRVHVEGAGPQDCCGLEPKREVRANDGVPRPAGLPAGVLWDPSGVGVYLTCPCCGKHLPEDLWPDAKVFIAEEEDQYGNLLFLADGDTEKEALFNLGVVRERPRYHEEW